MARSLAPTIGRIHLSRPNTHDKDLACKRAADHTFPTASTTTNYNYLWDTHSEGKVSLVLKEDSKLFGTG
jgi:hypothetical protein